MWVDSAAGAVPVRITSGSELTRALYVRDRFALPSALAVPALDPPVATERVGDVPSDVITTTVPQTSNVVPLRAVR